MRARFLNRSSRSQLTHYRPRKRTILRSPQSPVSQRGSPYSVSLTYKEGDLCDPHIAFLKIRNVNFAIAPRRGSADGGDDSFNPQSNALPLRTAQNHKRDSPTRKLLLVPNASVGGQKYVESAGFRRGEPVPVRQTIPPAILRSCDDVSSHERR